MSRSLGQLFASSDILSGEEAERMRQYYGTAYMDPDKHLKDPYGVLIKDGDLTPIQEHFQSRIQHFEGRRHEAAQELFRIRWGPTHIPVYTALLIFTLNNPGSRYKYINVAEWLVDTAKVPVDGTDVSGTTALMHSISTKTHFAKKPYFDPEFAQLMLDAGGDINRQDRYGGVAAHDITTSQLLFGEEAYEQAGHALQWYLEHGGDLDVESGEGTCVRHMIARLANTDRTLNGVVDRFEQQKKEGTIPGFGAIPRPTARNSPCPCGSGRKFKKCCGNE